MLTLNLQRSPRYPHSNLHSQPSSASRLHRSASVPKLQFSPPPPSPPPSPPSRSKRGHPRKRNHRHDHSAPYPLSYERNILNCDALDHTILKSLRHSCSWFDYTKGGHPRRALDLGCGPGAWVLEAANEWPDCEFVGFDLVDLQTPPHRLVGTLGKRITWVHGNFLNVFPFEDGYFDHVHIRQIARGVPEDKWDHIIAEVVRVLKVGGNVEIFEEDIIFPVLPRSSTALPRQRHRKLSILGPSSSITKQLSPLSLPDHDHAVLETLFYRVFERRFINLRPTALIMGTLNIHLRHAGASPLINFPLPPPPRPPTPPSRSSTVTPRVCSPEPPPAILPRRNADIDEDSVASSSLRSSLQSTPATSIEAVDDPAEGPVAFYSDAGLASVSSGKGEALFQFLPEERLQVTAGTLGLNLYRSWQGVMACREAMWDEYARAVHLHDSMLDQLEWEEHELNLSDRERFDTLVGRYQADMEARYPIASALASDLHWIPPRREVNKEDEETRRAVAEARRDALRLEKSGIGAVPEASRVCRKGRIFLSCKGAGFGGE